jgi:CBS domain-containing protein
MDMKAADVMVSAVISVCPNARVEEVARILLANRISAVPVINEEGELLGIVSEGDLMRRAEAGTERRRSWWLEQFTGKQVLAAEYVRSHSHKVTDVMTRSVITATPDTPLGEIATLLEKNRIKRVPIVQNGKVVGIVSRANLLQALASIWPAKDAATTRADDAEIRDKVLSRLDAELWRPTLLNVTVHDGTVDLWGSVGSDDERKAARIAVEGIAGVKSINDHLTIPPPETAMV